MKSCPKCYTIHHDDVVTCVCGHVFEPKAARSERNLVVAAREAEHAVPGLATVFRVLGVLEILGGIVICFVMWPGEARVGYEWRAIAYMPALTWLIAGIIFGCLFLAVAEGLTYLCQIRDAVTKKT